MSRFVILSLCIMGGFAMVFSINSGGSDDIRIRNAGVDGSFYPNNPVELKTMINAFLSQTEKINLPGPVMGLVSPPEFKK